MGEHDVDAVALAAIALVARLMNALRDAGRLTSEEITDVINLAIQDQRNKPNGADVVAVIQGLVKN